MATSFDQIEDIALVVINDYKLKKIYDQSEDAFKQYLDGFLIESLPNFYLCRQSLDYNDDNREFSANLTGLEMSILADFCVIAWWKRETNNAAQIALKLKVSNSFTYNSESQNFKEKQNIIDKLKEDVDRKITAYQLQDLDAYPY